MTIVKIGGQEVNLDSEVLKFSPETMNEFLSQYASLARYYNDRHADASYIASRRKDAYATLFNQKFKSYKLENGYSDKMAEACAKCDPEVVSSQEKMRDAEYVKDVVYGFIRSMDDAHEDAKEMCYNLRKELDKIYPKHVRESGGDRVERLTSSYQEDKLKEIFG